MVSSVKLANLLNTGEGDMTKDEIYATLRDRIVYHDYSPGDIINEKKLAAEFGLSRTPLREVLSRLEREKLVRVIPRTGTMVSEIEVNKIRQVFQVRMEVESLTGRLAAQGITEDHFSQLADLAKHCASLKNEYRPKDLIMVDVLLRKILLEAAGNEILTEMSSYLYNLTVRIWTMLIDRNNYEYEVDLRLDEIEKTIAALRAGDPEKTGRLKQDLLSRYIQRVRDRI